MPSYSPRVYVACLASYNAGILHGEWIDATDADELREAIQGMLAQSPEPNAEECAIHDFDFHGVQIDEYADLDRVAEIGALIEEHGSAFAAYADNVGIDYATADAFQDAYCGEWDSERHYAEDLFDELYSHDVPDHTIRYHCPDRGIWVDVPTWLSVPPHAKGHVLQKSMYPAVGCEAIQQILQPVPYASPIGR